MLSFKNSSAGYLGGFIEILRHRLTRETTKGRQYLILFVFDHEGGGGGDCSPSVCAQCATCCRVTYEYLPLPILPLHTEGKGVIPPHTRRIYTEGKKKVVAAACLGDSIVSIPSYFAPGELEE